MRWFLLFPFFITSVYSDAQEYLVPVDDTIEILVDRWGVPHIYAATESDLFFAQGFNAARDRLFQFEIWRRQATGTVAEILGKEELKRDIGTRLFKFRGDLRKEFDYYHPKGSLIISSFVDGVNAYIRYVLQHRELLPVEFEILGILPILWSPEVVISRHQGLLGNIKDELAIGRMVHLVGAEKVKELMWFHPFEPDLELDDQIDGTHLLEDILDLYNAYRKPVRFSVDGIGFGNKEESGDYDRSALWDRSSNLGSNNWVVNGDYSQSDYPMMANDPHRTLAVPSLRYMSHLVGPGWNVIGGGEPEIPGISIGHNEYGAWGLTVFSTDAEDLYVYRLDPNDPDRYFHNGEWIEMVIITDTIPIKGESPVVTDLKYTLHGPVVMQDSSRHIGYAVKCGWLEPGGSPYLASLRMDQSFDFESFREACNYSHIPGENMVWADRAGNIGWQAVGIAPLRMNFSGLVPIPGDGSHEWQGYLEIKKKPHLFNPHEGFIITANENLTSIDYPYPEAIGYSWSDPVRGDRIRELIHSGKKLTMADMCQIQNDHLSIPARTLISFLSAVKPTTEAGKKARSILMDWDYRMDVLSRAATIYFQFEKNIKAGLYEMKVPPEIRKYIGRLQFKKIIDFLTFPDGDFGDDPILGRDSFLLSNLEQSVLELSSLLGPDMSTWQYGQPRFKHVKINHTLSHLANDSLRAKMNMGPLPRGGNGSTVGNTSNNLNQSHGATFKIIIDTENWDRALAINAPGQSGNPNSLYYDNLFELWAGDRYFPLFYSRKKIESVTEHRILLIPE